MIVVAKDGTGDYTSLQEAVDAIPEADGGARAMIRLRAGEYREKVVIHKDHVRLIGATASELCGHPSCTT